MERAALAWRVWRSEGLPGLTTRASRVIVRQMRGQAYRWRRRLGRGAASPVSIVADDLEPAHCKLLEAIWQRGEQGSLRVLLPDYLHFPLTRLLRQCGGARIVPLNYGQCGGNAGQPFNACVLQDGQLHRLPLALIQQMLDHWTVVAAEGSAGLFCPRDAQAGRADSELGLRAAPMLAALRRSARALEELAAHDFLYDAPGGGQLRCHYSDMEIGMVEEVWREYLQPVLDLPPGAVVVDIGANLGAFAVACGMRIGHGHVYAYEPCPDNFALLAENIARNCAGAVTPHRLAVHKDSAPRRLFLDPQHSGGHSVYEMRWTRGAVEVPRTSLAEILADIDRKQGSGRVIDVLKIDAEGAEYEMLFGHAELLRERVRLLLMEVHRAGRWNCQDMLDFLTSLGFTVEGHGSANLMLLRAVGPAARAA